MKIKRLCASNIREATREVRDEPGADAVILSTQRMTSGSEIVAAVDYEQQPLEGVQQQVVEIRGLCGPPEQQLAGLAWGELAGRQPFRDNQSLPVAYLDNGQRAPENLQVARIDVLIRMGEAFVGRHGEVAASKVLALTFDRRLTANAAY